MKREALPAARMPDGVRHPRSAGRRRRGRSEMVTVDTRYDPDMTLMSARLTGSRQEYRLLGGSSVVFRTV